MSTVFAIFIDFKDTLPSEEDPTLAVISRQPKMVDLSKHNFTETYFITRQESSTK